jgi:non-heme chloroperoxidase
VPYVKAPDGADIFYKDWGQGQPVVFCHGWPLSSDIWDTELKLVADNGFRAIAHDRRGHGRSTQTWGRNDMDSYAEDLDALITSLDLRNVIVVGHSTGGGEAIRYSAKFGGGRVAKVVTVGAIPPVMLQSESNPKGTPIEVFDGIRASVLADRSQYYHDLSGPFYGANRPGSSVSQGVRDYFWHISMMAGLKNAYDCIRVFSETDFTEDLKRLDVPVMIAHGTDDQIVPIAASAEIAATLVRDATLKIYDGAPHGLVGDYQTTFGRDMLDFIRG